MHLLRLPQATLPQISRYWSSVATCWARHQLLCCILLLFCPCISANINASANVIARFYTCQNIPSRVNFSLSIRDDDSTVLVKDIECQDAQCLRSSMGRVTKSSDCSWYSCQLSVGIKPQKIAQTLTHLKPEQQH